jgi:hypothetical protein
LNLPIKRLVLDEPQLVNKRNTGNEGVRHGAIKDLYYKAIVMLSGNPAHNRWQDFSGLVDFLEGHPFTNHTLFLKACASLDHEGKPDRPDLPRMCLLQRFLQAFTIASPSDILKLKECTRARCLFKIRRAHKTEIESLVRDYQRLIAIKNDKNADKNEANASKAFSFAVRAQLLSMSPFLLEERPGHGRR